MQSAISFLHESSAYPKLVRSSSIWINICVFRQMCSCCFQ